MTTVPADVLRTLKAPSARKGHIWEGGVFQVHLGRACSAACFGCTQGSQLAGKAPFMTVEQFEVAIRSLMEPEPWHGVVGLFGGSTANHPRFAEICEVYRRLVPYRQRGLWCNDPHGQGAVIRETFRPEISNINVHMDERAHAEFLRDWPEIAPFIKGFERDKAGNVLDSRHSPPWVAMRDLEDVTDRQRWDYVKRCTVNRDWSPLIGTFRGELRGWFCEIAGAQAMLHQWELDYPDTGCKVEPGWWRKPMEAYAHQVERHCFDCSHPIRALGDFAITGHVEHVSKTHAGIFRPKVKGRRVVTVTHLAQLAAAGEVEVATRYIENGRDLANRPLKVIDALTTCVGPYYAGLLDRTLPTWLAEADTVTVVTMPDDPALEVVRRHASPKLHVVTTSAFREHGAAFNKFAALGVALEAISRAGMGGDWLLHFDADTAAEKGWRAKADPKLARGFLGGVHRYDERGRKIPDDPFGCGFVHVWHASDPHAQRRPLWEPWWGHAGHGDREFLERWNAERKIRDLGFRATHIGEPRSNWFGPENPENAARMAELHRIGLGEARFVEKPLEIPSPWVVAYEVDGVPGEVDLNPKREEAAA